MFSKNNPYAPYASHDEEAKRNASFWELRLPVLSIADIKEFNEVAEKWYWTSFTNPEKNNADCGAYHAKKDSFAIVGLFKNYGTSSSFENITDFALYYYDKEDEDREHYIGASNSLDELMKLAEKIRQNFCRAQIIDLEVTYL